MAQVYTYNDNALTLDRVNTANYDQSDDFPSPHKLNYLSYGGDNSLIRFISYSRFSATSFDDIGLNFSYDSALLCENGLIPKCDIESKFFFNAGGQDSIYKCYTNDDIINISDRYGPISDWYGIGTSSYNSQFTNQITLGWRKTLYPNNMHTTNMNYGKNWGCVMFFFMGNTPVISNWAYSNQYYPTINASNINSSFLSLFQHPTLSGYLIYTHYGNPPSGKSKYDNITHHCQTKYSLIPSDKSDFGLYNLICTAITSCPTIYVVVFTDIPYNSSDIIHLKYRWWNTNANVGSIGWIFDKIRLNYIGVNLYGQMFSVPTGYPSFPYIYTGELTIPKLDYWWASLRQYSWIELYGLTDTD